MLLKSLKVKPVVTKISRGKIHGQGDFKRYVYILLETDAGNSFSEVYCGSYDFHSVTAIVKNLEEKLIGKPFGLQDVLDNKLHQPFISGGGVHQTIISSIYNCILLLDLSWKSDLSPAIKPGRTYISGGTVKSTIKEMETEIAFAKSLGLSDYKVRLDYRDLDRCFERIDFLNQQSVNYAVDLIVNTNHTSRNKLPLSSLLERFDTSKLLWLEEPVFPTAPEEWESVLQLCREMNITVALGESLTSKLELEYVLNHPMVGMVQIDATHCSDLLTLQSFKQRVINSKKVLGFHNWGSYVTLILNGFLNETSGRCFFEIPFYQTDFDAEVIQSLDCRLETLGVPSVCFDDFDSIREALFEVISRYAEKDYKDFSWS